MASYFVRKGVLEILKSVKKCVYCDSEENLTIDHIHPRIKGGGNYLDNLTVACLRCNLRKSDFSISEFLHRMINKRNLCYDKCLTCLYSIRRSKQRGTKAYCKYGEPYEKLKKERLNHSYYYKVIGNILNGKYQLNDLKENYNA